MILLLVLLTIQPNFPDLQHTYVSIVCAIFKFSILTQFSVCKSAKTQFLFILP